MTAGADNAFLSATDALALMRSRELSPVELVEAVIERGDEVAEDINPFSARYSDHAREAARAAEARYADGTARRLEGIPVGVKELTAVAGQQHTLASLALKDNVATETAPMVERLLEAGAIIHARTTTPEFGCASFTHSRLYGETKNPWNTEWSTAGSSGGSAAALAAGAATLATGTDSAGSLRLPASACGVVGFKPSFGIVPTPLPFGFETVHHDGPMARTVGDAALMLDVMAGPSPSAPHQNRPAPDLSGIEEGVDGWRIALLSGIDGLDVDPEVDAHVRASADALASTGAQVEEIDLGWTYDDIIEATKLHYAGAYGPTVQRLADAVPELLTDYALAFAAEEQKYAARPGFVVEARERIAALWAPLARVFETHQLLLLPTLQMPAPELGEPYIDRGPVVAGVEQADRWIVGTTVAFNLCHWLPAVSVPSGLAANGIPTGVQIVGRPYSDAAVLRASRALEIVRPWPDHAAVLPQL